MAPQFRHFAIEQLADGVWAALHRMWPPAPDAWAISNAGIVDLGGRTLVFDTLMTTAAAAELSAAAEELTGRPPEVVVLSHGHNDHAWGSSQFPDATIVSSARARAELVAEGFAEVEACRDVLQERLAFWTAAADGDDVPAQADAAFFLPYWHGLADSLTTLELRLPDMAIEGRLDIHGTARRVEITTVDRAHTDGDLILVLPDERVTFCGDLLFVGCHPYLGDGGLGGLRTALAMLEASDSERFVPGHGPVGWAEDLAMLATYLDDVQRIAATAGEAVVPDTYRAWPLGRFFTANLEFAAGPGSAKDG
jgi:cyclase